jgi:Uma2 family endonuclease
MSIREIILPETEPETEWVRGRALQKVSPTYAHAFMQSRVVSILIMWARGRGRVGTEWRFRIAPANSYRRPLVPDVAFLSNERVRALPEDEREVPTIAPDLAVEILSPGDRKADVEAKCAVYLAAGVRTILLIDPDRRSVEVRNTHEIVRFDAPVTLDVPGFAGLSIPFADLYAEFDESP